MVETRLLRIPSRGHGPTSLGLTSLGLLEKTAPIADRRLPPVLLLHGSTFGAALFCLPRAGYSLMAELAGAGRAVYALDIGGYGTSPGGAVMDRPAHENPPFAGAEAAVADIADAVEFILTRQATEALDLVGFSWGTITAARYAGEHPGKVARLALYAPLYGERNPAWLDRIADPQDRTHLAPAFGAYRLVTLADVVRRWNADLPDGDPALYREDGVAELVFETLAALDPMSAFRVPRSFRCPNGALGDLVQVFNGQPAYDPTKLTMPVLLLRGADDTTSTDSDAQHLLSRIASHDKDYRIMAPGSHFLCIEKNRSILYRELNGFLGPVAEPVCAGRMQ